MRITTGDTMHVYGAIGAGVDYTVRFKVRLTDAIDGAVLAEAVSKASARFPYFSGRLVRTGDAYEYEDNPLPITVNESDSKVVLNSASTNYHVWAVSYQGDAIYLDFFHGITDGTGMYRVLAAILYHYCREVYGIEEIAELDSSDIDAETEDPQDKMDPVPVPDVSYTPAFTLETDGGLTFSLPVIWDIRIPEEAFVGFVRTNDSTPGTMVEILMGKAIDSLYPGHEKPIISTYVINARPMVGAVPTSHNCLGMSIFNYSSVIGSMPLEKQGTVYRGKTFAQSREEAVVPGLAVNATVVRSVLADNPSLSSRKEIFTAMFNAGEGFITYLVSYPGKWKYPSIGQYMKEFWTHPPCTFGLMVILGAAGGNISLSIQQRFAESSVVEAFLALLDGNGIPYNVVSKETSDVAGFEVPG
ncbi:MAG: hypothetical protein IKF09_00600 [Clostridiales bacterium]|nr:hypothetical protein [Clostridiales bacterium]